jgi:small subunit ribosomal protein S33
VATIKDLKNAYKHFDEEMETWDDDEEDRLERLILAKQRGKGAPKKKRSADGKCALCALGGGR